MWVYAYTFFSLLIGIKDQVTKVHAYEQNSKNKIMHGREEREREHVCVRMLMHTNTTLLKYIIFQIHKK